MLTASDLSDTGFQDIDSARPILEVHRVLLRTWIDSRGNEGPNQKKLASKDYMPKLKDKSVYDVVTFHSNLVNASLNYNVALVPFDSIEIHFGAIGLCPPGLGKKRYDEMARALFVALQNGLIPSDDRTANAL